MKLRINPLAGVQAANIGTGKKPEIVSKAETFEVTADAAKKLLTKKRGDQPIFEEVTNDKERDE